jgi:hypothetical protein
MMIAKRWRQRAVYAAMSAFVAWHSFAILVGPAPGDSEDVDRLLSLLHPYLTLLALDNQWDFFAPGINSSYKIRYELESAGGASHEFTPEGDWKWYHPSFYWFTEWRDAISDEPEVYAPFAGEQFCREHAALRPIAVTLVKVEQTEFWPQDYLAGRHPFDSDYVTEEILMRVPCPPL